MKKTLQCFALIFGILIVSGLMTRLWLMHPECFPAFPGSWAEYLSALYGAKNAEEIADLEILIGFLIWISAISVAVFALGWLRPRLRKSATRP
jgi:hypothetical protein